MKTDIVKSLFEDLPDKLTRDYELSITKISDYCAANKLVPELVEAVDEGTEYSFSAFLCLCTLYRRAKDFELLHDLFNSHEEFKNEPLFNHYYVQYLVHSESFYDYDELLRMAYDNTVNLPKNEGTCQAFANAFATICEHCNEEDRAPIIEEWYDKALKCIHKAIDCDPSYAKFYVTKARILALKGNYEDAEELIVKAISKENSSRTDYALVIGNYQSYRLTFQFERRIAELESRLRKLEQLASVDLEQQDESSGKEKRTPEPYIGELPFAFVSYAHKDSDEVYEVLRRIDKKGVRFWFDKGIAAGAEWPEVLANYLTKSSTVLVMLSPSALASANVRREVNYALSEGKNIVVIELDDVELTPGMKLQFGLYQMIRKQTCTASQFITKLTEALNTEM